MAGDADRLRDKPLTPIEWIILRALRCGVSFVSDKYLSALTGASLASLHVHVTHLRYKGFCIIKCSGTRRIGIPGYRLAA